MPPAKTTTAPRRRAARATARIGWIVGSLAERDAALDLLGDDGPGEPRDELGIGPLRDAFANAFFPGVTTLQTRAKYFVLVPAMYAQLEREASARRDPAAAVALAEQALLEALLSRTDTAGVIGRRFRRVPATPASAIYWSGLRTWGIRTFSDSRVRYHAWLRSASAEVRPEHRDDEPEDERRRWLLPAGWEERLADPHIELDPVEADFLDARISGLTVAGRVPLLRELLDKPADRRRPLWEVPHVASGRADFAPEALHARELSAAVHGAMLLYNLRCADVKGDRDAVERFAERLGEWRTAHPSDHWREWDLADFWADVERLPDGRAARNATKGFVARWIEVLRRPDVRLAVDRAPRELLEARERQTKPGRERLTGPKAVDGWKASGLGVDPLDYRWRQAGRIIGDVRRTFDARG